MAEIEKKYGDNVKVVFVQLPLGFHKRAMPAAMAVEAAGAQGKFWEYHDMLWENNKALEDADLEKYAKDLGLDVEQWKKDLKNPEIIARVERNAAMANALGIQGTPGFFVNGEQVKGAKPIDDFAKIIDKHLKIADALVEKGVPVEKLHAILTRKVLGGKYYEYVIEGKEPPKQQAEKGDKKAKPPFARKQNEIPIGSSPRKGEGNEVVITEFSDFECPYCSRVVPMLDEVQKHYGDDRASLTFHQFPLSFHKQAQIAAEASLAAHAQGKFWPMYHKLFDNQKQLTRADLEKYAKEIGLDMDRFKKDLDEKTWADAVREDMALGRKVGVSGTPAIYINGRQYQGERTTEAMIKNIDEKLLGGKAKKQEKPEKKN